jgi:hypothetical protein
MSAAHITQQIKNLERELNQRHQKYINSTFNNPGRYAPFHHNKANENKLKKLKKNLNQVIHKEGNSLAKNVRNAEANYKNLKNNMNAKLFHLRSKKYSHLFNDPRLGFGRQYPRLGNEGRPTLNQYNAEAKTLLHEMHKAENQMHFLKKKFNQRKNMARAIIKKHMNRPKPGGLLNRIRYEPNYGINYAKTRGGSSLAKPRSNENWARMLREARRQGRMKRKS